MLVSSVETRIKPIISSLISIRTLVGHTLGGMRRILPCPCDLEHTLRFARALLLSLVLRHQDCMASPLFLHPLWPMKCRSFLYHQPMKTIHIMIWSDWVRISSMGWERASDKLRIMSLIQYWSSQHPIQWRWEKNETGISFQFMQQWDGVLKYSSFNLNYQKHQKQIQIFLVLS